MKNAAFKFAVIVGSLLIGGASRLTYAGSSWGENKRVVVSTVPTSPTLISDASFGYKRSSLINNTTYWCMFGDQNTTFSSSSSTGTARITNREWSPDGPYVPYTGKIYGVCENVAAIIDCIRVK